MSRHPLTRWCARLPGFVFALAAGVAMAGAPGGLVIDKGWTFRLMPGHHEPGSPLSAHPEAAPWHTATVPGTVHTDLLAHKLIPDPYVGAPDAGLQWIGLADWEYRTTFDAPRASLRSARSDLVFEGLDTFAEVWLNGARLLGADNAFRTWRVPVQGRLRAKGNELRIVLRSPIARLLPQVEAMPHKLAGNYPSPYGDEPQDAMTGNFVRKPGYHFGRDWGPRYVTASISKPVVLQSWDAVRVDDLQLRQDHVDGGRAGIAAIGAIDAVRDSTFDLRLWQTAPDGKRALAAQRRVLLRAGANRIELSVHVDHPQRWFPNGYGAQPLYRYELELKDGKTALATIGKCAGLRSIELRRDPDARGKSFYFAVNGIPVFAKGANTIPFDMFQPRVRKAQLRRVLQSAHDANLNFLRSWGGGYYESEDFYDLADEFGLLVWQDFMFGGGMQPAYDDAFRANVILEAHDQVRRLRNHPSLALWCGNNEEEIAWKYWGHGKTLKEADAAFADRVWKGYVQLFGTDLRTVVAEEGGGVAYWASSPGDDLAEAHQKFMAGKGSDRLMKYVSEEFGEPADFAGFVYLSQVMQAEGIELAALHHRASRPFTMGSLYWQLNDVWPGASWSSVDWFGRWKALQFHARRFYAPVAVAALRDPKGRTAVSLLNDRTQGVRGELRLRVMRLDGQLLCDERKPVELPPLSAAKVLEYPDAELLGNADPASAVAVFDLQVQGEPASRGVVYFAAARRMAWRPAERHGEPHEELRAEPRRDGAGQVLEITASALARAVWIDFGDLDAELSDNALTLLPGERATLRVTATASDGALRAALRIRSLADAVRANNQ